MAQIDSMIPDVMVEVVGCPRALIMRELVSAARHFCQETQAWRDSAGTIYPESDLLDYTLDLPDGAALVAVITDLPAEVIPPNVLRFQDVPEQVSVEAALQPAYDSNVLGDQVASQYREAITSGALTRLLMMDGRPWANPGLAAYHGNIVADAISRARAREAQGYANRPITISPVRSI